MQDKIKVIFLDRDGVVNFDDGYIYKTEDVKLMPYLIRGLQLLQEKGYKLVITTNQPGIGYGYYTKKEFKDYMRALEEKLAPHGIRFFDVLYCPHTKEDKCHCRKPATGIIDRFLEQNDVDLKNSWVIGDRLSDMKFAENIGCKGVQIISPLTAANMIIHGELR